MAKLLAFSYEALIPLLCGFYLWYLHFKNGRSSTASKPWLLPTAMFLTIIGMWRAYDVLNRAPRTNQLQTTAEVATNFGQQAQLLSDDLEYHASDGVQIHIPSGFTVQTLENGIFRMIARSPECLVILSTPAEIALPFKEFALTALNSAKNQSIKLLNTSEILHNGRDAIKLEYQMTDVSGLYNCQSITIKGESHYHLLIVCVLASGPSESKTVAEGIVDSFSVR